MARPLRAACPARNRTLMRFRRLALLAGTSLVLLSQSLPATGAVVAAAASPQSAQVGGLTFTLANSNGQEVTYQGAPVDLGGSPLGNLAVGMVTVTNSSGAAVSFPSFGKNDEKHATTATYRGEFLLSEYDCVVRSPLPPGDSCSLVLGWTTPAIGQQTGTFEVTYTTARSVPSPAATTLVTTSGAAGTTTTGSGATGTTTATSSTSTTTTGTTTTGTTTTGTTATGTTTTTSEGATTPGTAPGTTTATATFAVRAEGDEGYYVVGRSNQISGFGDIDLSVDTLASQADGRTIVGAVVSPSGTGLLTVASDGRVFSFGGASLYGPAAKAHVRAAIVGIAAHVGTTKTGPQMDGYWLLADNGAIFTYGRARFFGSLGRSRRRQHVTAMAATPDQLGYWVVTKGGAVLSFGDAHFYGAMGDKHLDGQIVAIAPTPDGQGYWLFFELRRGLPLRRCPQLWLNVVPAPAGSCGRRFSDTGRLGLLPPVRERARAVFRGRRVRGERQRHDVATQGRGHRSGRHARDPGRAGGVGEVHVSPGRLIARRPCSPPYCRQLSSTLAAPACRGPPGRPCWGACQQRSSQASLDKTAPTLPNCCYRRATTS